MNVKAVYAQTIPFSFCFILRFVSLTLFVTNYTLRATKLWAHSWGQWTARNMSRITAMSTHTQINELSFFSNRSMNIVRCSMWIFNIRYIFTDAFINSPSSGESLIKWKQKWIQYILVMRQQNNRNFIFSFRLRRIAPKLNCTNKTRGVLIRISNYR